jgi:hypothetical protein|tara:strand:- start:66 stop:212 length:147 start_codon:yes stop_codon:yes gene_type:complete
MPMLTRNKYRIAKIAIVLRIVSPCGGLCVLAELESIIHKEAENKVTHE